MRTAARWAILGAVTLGYVALFYALAPRIGIGAAAGVFGVVVTAGLLLGMRVGIAVGAMASVLNLLLVHPFFGTPIDASILFYLVLQAAVGGGAGWMHDVRERLREGAERDRLLVDHNPLPVLVVDLATCAIVDVNPAAVAHYGYSRERWLAMNLRDLLTPDERSRLDAPLPGESAPVTLDTRHVRADGRVIEVTVTAKIMNVDGRQLSYGICQDVTERKRAEEMLRRNDRLAALGTLVAGVAHEVNNPLAYMLGNVELTTMAVEEALRRPDLPPGLRAELETILRGQDAVQRGIEQISRITRGLKQVARREEGSPEPVDVDGLVRDTLAVAQPRIGKDVDLRVELGGAGRVHAVPGELSQVVLNLVFNAADAVRGRASPVIAVRTRRVGGEVGIEVEDNGCGIPEAHRTRVFAPFHTTKPEGTGLGLSVSQRIVADHGGSISFETEEGRGTRFRVRLPAREHERAPLRVAHA